MARYAVVVAALAALALTALSGIIIVPMLRKLKLKQVINEIGPTWHQEKNGIPTMGGLMLIIGSTLGLIVALPLVGGVVSDTDPLAGQILMLGMFTTLAFSAVGFLDDYMKVSRKRNLGLSGTAKLIMQSVITIGFLVTLRLMDRLPTSVQLPFIGEAEFGIFFYPLSFLLIVGMVNAVNLTDGIDGLASLVTLWVMCGYFVLLIMFDKYRLAIWAAALAGACVGFLFWNFYPAKVFMGDTGSMFLGGAVVSIGYCMGRPDIIIILGVVYLVEAFSVMLQRTVFKITKKRTGTGRRLFKMSPIHHHFEMMGWSEVKIDAVFSFVTLVCAILAIMYVRLWG